MLVVSLRMSDAGTSALTGRLRTALLATAAPDPAHRQSTESGDVARQLPKPRFKDRPYSPLSVASPDSAHP